MSSSDNVSDIFRSSGGTFRSNSSGDPSLQGTRSHLLSRNISPSKSSLSSGELKRPQGPNANRLSMVSSYSGVVHNADVDTIRYVVTKTSPTKTSTVRESSGLMSELRTVGNESPTNSLKHSSGSQDLNKILHEDDDEEGISEPLVLPSTPKSNKEKEESPSKTPEKQQAVDIEIPIPARSTKRPNSVYLSPDVASPVNNFKDFSIDTSAIGPKKSRTGLMGPRSPPPSTPLPSPKKSDFESTVSLSPTRRRDSGARAHKSVNSTSSKLDIIMQEVEDLRSEMDEEGQSSSPKIVSQTASLMTSSDSFHTAHSPGFDWEDADDDEARDEYPAKKSPDEHSEGLRVQQELDRLERQSVSTLQTRRERAKASPHNFTSSRSHLSVITMTENANSNPNINGRTAANRLSSSSPRKVPSASPSFTSSVASDKKEEKKLKSFSYNTLARLLNATDGIVIGQEFASLGMPNEEKYLIERIVGSLSRLTANMMINPNRYDQSCARLEKVLNVLEGFD
ncbi:DEKNAAC104852 [Brettanomyces naardenensis]|uniref:DEKNAAC104852 n=1 Tax=Brettanomyces naardenensis TaxID=13370 RepID=A0A448YS62_BRENA|nr:DEKNAAC104852 [Brettanomyces naardenensis]